MKYFITKNDAYAIYACQCGIERYANGRDKVSVYRALKDAERNMSYGNSYTWEYILLAIVYKYKLAQVTFDYIKAFHDPVSAYIQTTQECINTQSYLDACQAVVNLLYSMATDYQDTSFRGPFMAWMYNEVKKTGQGGNGK